MALILTQSINFQLFPSMVEENVMVWRCFSCDGSGPIHQIEGIMDGNGYKILKMILAHGKEKSLVDEFSNKNDPNIHQKSLSIFFSVKKI